MCKTCDLSSNDKSLRKQEYDRLIGFSSRLEDLAVQYRRQADGGIKPHSAESSGMGIAARNLIRDLVEEWV